MVFQAEDRARTKKQRTEAAIQLALQGRWDDAASLNRSIIDLFPTDVDAYNRLGKAATELGRYAEARDAYQQVLRIKAGDRQATERLKAIEGHLQAQTASQPAPSPSPDTDGRFGESN